MLAFITSLRHPENSSSYEHVERLLRSSLRSVCAQTADKFEVVVVGNRALSFQPPAGVRFVEVDFPPPSTVRGPRTGREAVLRDKGTKLAVALLAAVEHDPTHVMAFDADDFVSNRIAEHVADSPSAPGWFVDSGWRYSPSRASVRSQPDFFLHCGTSHIIRTDLFGAPAIDPRWVDQDKLEDVFGDRLLTLLASHLYAVDRLADAGTPLTPLPFAGALYTVGTGENHSGISMGGLGRPVSAGLAAEFSIPPTKRDPVSLARAVLPGGRAFARRAEALAGRFSRRPV